MNATYTPRELREFLDGISVKLCSLESAQYWKYDKDTADEIIFLKELEQKIKRDIESQEVEEYGS